MSDKVEVTRGQFMLRDCPRDCGCTEFDPDLMDYVREGCEDSTDQPDDSLFVNWFWYMDPDGDPVGIEIHCSGPPGQVDFLKDDVQYKNGDCWHDQLMQYMEENYFEEREKYQEQKLQWEEVHEYRPFHKPERDTADDWPVIKYGEWNLFTRQCSDPDCECEEEKNGEYVNPLGDLCGQTISDCYSVTFYVDPDGDFVAMRTMWAVGPHGWDDFWYMHHYAPHIYGGCKRLEVEACWLEEYFEHWQEVFYCCDYKDDKERKKDHIVLSWDQIRAKKPHWRKDKHGHYWRWDTETNMAGTFTPGRKQHA